VLHFSRNICPHTERNVFSGFLQSKLLLLIALNLPIAWLFPLDFKFLFSILSIVLNISEDFGRDVVILVNHDLTDLLDVILAPSYLTVVVLRQRFPKQKINGFNDIFSNLAVISSLLQSFVFGLSPEGDEGGQVRFVIGIWQRIAQQELVVQVLLPRLDREMPLLNHGGISFLNEWGLFVEAQ
jgi:hypothetical protein